MQDTGPSLMGEVVFFNALHRHLQSRDLLQGTAMTYETLLYAVKDNIATLTLNRPDRLNALNDTLRDDLYDAIGKSAADPEVRVLVITGAGRGFCSGGDVKGMSERNQSGATAPLVDKYAPKRDRIIAAMRDCLKPIIAAVNGAAAGAGMNVAL